jgi:hypothetical protein
LDAADSKTPPESTVPRALRFHLMLATAAGMFLRIVLSCFVNYDTNTGDAVVYDRLARNLAWHGVYSYEVAAPYTPSAYRPPLLPFLASLSYRMFGTDALPMHVLHALLGLAAALVVTLTVHRAAPAAAKLTAWFTMLSPFDAIYAGRLLSEPLATFFVCAGIAIPFLYPTVRAWALAGVLLAAAALARDQLLPVIPAAAVLALAFPTLRGKASRVAPAMLLVCSALVLAPWMYRNGKTIGTFALSSGRMGTSLWVGTWARDGSFVTPDGAVWPDSAYENEAERALLAPLPVDTASDEVFKHAALTRMREHPGRTLARWVMRAPKMWFGTRTDLFEFRNPFTRPRAAWFALKVSCFGLNAAWLALATVGLVSGISRTRRLIWLALPIVLTFLVYFPFYNCDTRYSQPIYPLVLAFSAIGGVRLLEAVTAYRRRRISAATA